MKKFFAFLLMFGMIASMGIATVGCSKKADDKKIEKKEDKKEDKK